MASPAPAAPKPQDKFSVDKATYGSVTVLTLAGTLNDAFEGRKIAEAIRTKKVVVSMRGVRRFASWGMSEWMDFLRINADRDLYLVECSTYAVSQINLVTGLLGHGKLTSFYASYRCGSCSEELETLFVIPRDRETIRDLPTSHQQCPACGGRARLEEYPAAFFDTIAGRPSFDIDDEVLGLFRTRLGYDLVPDLSRFRAYRTIQNGYTYLRLSGSLALLPAPTLAAASEGTTVADLAGIVFDPAQVGPWRAYIQAALARVKSLQLVNCPPGFLEHAVSPEDLHDKLKIRTFALAYDCVRCDTTIAHMVDVAENLEQLVGGIAPPAKCPACQSPLVPGLTPHQLMHLPARDRDAALDKFLARSASEPADKLENCLVAVPRTLAKPGAGSSRGMYIAIALSTLVIAAIVGIGLWKGRGDGAQVVVNPAPIATPPATPTFVRPDWIISDVPASAYCHEMINRVMCIGVSAYRATRDDAVAEANDAALEELVSTVGLKIAEPTFRETIMPAYSEVRAKALTALQAADVDRTSPAYAAAAAVVRKARKHVVEVLQVSGGAAVPSQRSDWYWEEYAGEKGKPNEILVFVRYDVSLDAMRALVDRYAAISSVMGSSVMTVYPAMAWQYAELSGGALITKAGRVLANSGIARQQIVVAVGDQRVSDAPSFARRIEEAPPPPAKLKLTVKTGDAPPQVIEVRR